ncbi:MAG TPA: hypothetical protein VE934_15170 [Polaromonas sp.]|uniref:hypothetical protein n=1 Tax=Polaromonas sp. TaxID=1869339 RepID=UPI002D383AE8|nr:hypothetical protein [Polaromonas sp.]HYW58295.1 hypothetical protein [Polaromonas sp.]
MHSAETLIEFRIRIDAERLLTLKRLDRFRKLSDAMMAFQNRRGPAPTTEDFETWRKQV